MPRNDRERLEDAVAAAESAVAFAGGFTLDALRADPRTLAAIKYELVVLGEAVAGLGEGVTARASSLPWAQMRALRNVVTHEYFRVDVEVLYRVVTADLPALLPELLRLLEESR